MTKYNVVVSYRDTYFSEYIEAGSFGEVVEKVLENPKYKGTWKVRIIKSTT